MCLAIGGVALRNVAISATVVLFGISLAVKSSTPSIAYGLQSLALTWLLAYILFFVAVPQVFGVKCPRCRGLFSLPVLTRARDRSVYGGGLSLEGIPLQPIIERAFECPVCGYRKVVHVAGEGPYANDAISRLGDSRVLQQVAQKRLRDFPNDPPMSVEQWKNLLELWKRTDREEWTDG